LFAREAPAVAQSEALPPACAHKRKKRKLGTRSRGKSCFYCGLLVAAVIWLSEATVRADYVYYEDSNITLDVTPSIFGGYLYYWANGAGGSFTGQNWGGVSTYYNPNPPFDLITINAFIPPPGSHGDNNDTIVFQGTSGLFMGVPISSPDYGPASSTYTVTLNGSPTVHDTYVSNVGFVGVSLANLPASFTFSLAGTYTSTVQTILDAQQVTFNNSGTFTTPSLSVSGQVTVNGGTLHGDVTVIDDIIPSSFFAGAGSGVFSNVPILGTTLTITGSNSVFQAPTFVEVGVSTNGPASLVLSAGATGTVGSIYLGLGGKGSEGDITINAATLTSNSFIDVGESAFSTGKVGIVSGGQLTTEDAAIGFGNDALGSATLNGSGSKWTINGFVAIGYDGPDVTSTLTVQNHAMVTSQDYLALGGNVDPTNGNLTGNGSLSISSGGVVISGTTVPSASLAAAVGFGPNSTGTVLIDGTGSLWDIKQRLDIGYSSGSTGTVTVQNGGTLQVEADIIRIGRDAGSTGTLTFDGMGGSSPTLTFNGGASNQLIIGDGGTGNFFVQGGAQITVGASVIIGNEGNTGMGSGTGNATVKGQNSSWTINGNLTVGEGGTGTLMIMNGDTVSVSGTGILGDQNGSNGTLTLDGVGSKLTFTTSGNALMIGNDGIGTLTVQNGATVTLPATNLGQQTDGSGVINVMGKSSDGTTASAVTITGQLVVGYASGLSQQVYNGLFVSGGGQVMSAQAVIGSQPGSYGVVQISGQNSQWMITNSGGGSSPDLTVGSSGRGSFTLSDQANFTAGSVTLGAQGPSGNNAGGTGIVLIEGNAGTGNQTLFTTNGPLIIGDSGIGRFTANGGAQIVSSGTVVIANQPTSTVSTATITDPGTLWQISGASLTIGNGGTGVLTVQNGGAVNANQGIVYLGSITNGSNSQGTLTVTGDGSSFKAGGFSLGASNGGTATLNIQLGGQVTITTFVIPVGATGNTDTILVDGKSSTGTPSTLTVDQIVNGTSSSSVSITVSNQAILNVKSDGEFGVDGSGGTSTLTINSGGQFVAAKTLFFLGQTGAGNLNVTNGGSLTTEQTYIGGGSGPSTATIGGSGGAPATWTISAGAGLELLTINAGGTLAIMAGGTVTVAGNVTEESDPSAVITVSGANAVLTIPTTSFGQAFAAAGTVNIMGGGAIIAPDVIVSITGATTVNGANSTLRAAMINITGQGGLTLLNSGSAVVGAQVTVGTGTTLDLTGGGSMAIGSFVTGAANGQIVIGPTGTLTVNGTASVRAASNGMPDLMILPFGTLNGGGTVNGRLVSNFGRVGPNDPQTLTINGNYMQGSSGTLELQIAGAASIDSDHLVVTGQATLGGYLELDFTNGYAPTVGAIVNLLSFGSTIGQFAGVEVTGLLPGWTFTLNPTSTTLSLTSTSNGVSSPEFVVPPGPNTLLTGIFADQTVHFTGGVLEAATSSVVPNPVFLDVTGGIFQADAGTVSTLSGVISGPGSFTMTGAGLLTLSGNNTYTGGTFINSGVLAIFSDANLGAAGVGVSFGGGTLQALASFASPRAITINAGGGTIDTNSFNLTLSGILSGPGGLTKISPGTLTLTGNNLYTGGTAINGGVLAVASDANLGDPSGPLSFGGGALQALASFTSDRGMTLNTGGGTIDSNGFNLTLNGVISGPGGLTKIGTGTLSLEGENSYTGPTLVENGRLYIDGSVGGDVDVFSPGFLGGHGMIGGSLFNAGTVSPGNSPGTLTVAGNYVQSSAGTLTIEVGGAGAGQHDLLAVGGHAALAGTLQLVRLDNFNLQRGEVIPFLTATGGVSGVFSTVSNPFATGTFLNTAVVYGPTSVSLEMEQGSFAQYAKYARLSPNDQSIGSALDKVAFDPREKNLIAYLDGEPLSQLPKRFEQISPDQLTSINLTSFALATVQNTNLQRRAEDLRLGANGFSAAGFAMSNGGPSYSGSLNPAGAAGDAGPTGMDGKTEKEIVAPAAPDNRWGAFLTGTGEFVNVDGTENARGYDITTGGFTLGLDYKVTPHFALGVSAGYTGTSADLADGGRVLVNGGKGGLYGTYFDGGFYLDGVVNGGYNSYDTHREALHGEARGDTDGGEFNALLGTGYDWKRGGFTFGPIASFQYSYLGVGGFAETGSDAPLQIQRDHNDSIQTRLGFKANYQWKVGKVVIRPELRASWLHEYGDDKYAIGARFASGAGDVFVVDGSRIGRDGVLLGAGFTVQFNDRVSAYVFYDGDLGRTNYETNSVSGGFSLAF